MLPARLQRIALRYGLPLAFQAAKLVRFVADRRGRLCRIGITGSAGKTTSARLIAAVLATQADTLYQDRPVNGLPQAAKTLLNLRPRHRYCVQELAVPGLGMIAKSLDIFRPHIGVVTVIEADHRASFRDLDGTAAEKGKLIAALPSDGVAVLNADDPRVWAMRERTAAAVISYGLSEGVDVRGRVLDNSWPRRFSIAIESGGQQVVFNTRLVGAVWAGPVLAAAATATALGISLTQAAAALENVEPADGRMSVVDTPDGVTFIRDDWKAPFWTIRPSLDFLRTAQARRKVAVLGTISDYPGATSRRYRRASQMALEVADQVFFVGKMAHLAVKGRPLEGTDRLMAFETVYGLDRYFQSHLEPGDLVLLKGSGRADHIDRLVLSRTAGVACWRQSCGRFFQCSACPDRMTPNPPNS